MKYVLFLYICTLNPQPYCTQDQVINEKFETYYDCITKGYLYSYRHLTEMYDKDEIEQDKLAIKFQCRDMSTATW
mgnify:FL=1